MPDGQPALDPGDVVAQPPGGTRALAAAAVPGVELGRALAHRLGRGDRVEQVVVSVEIEVFAQHGQPQFAGEWYWSSM